MEDGTRAGWPGGQERLRALRYRCEYPRMVRGLVLRRLLRCRGRTQSAGTSQWIASSLARRILAALHEGLGLCPPFEHPSRISVRRLWLPRRPRCVDDCQPEPSGGSHRTPQVPGTRWGAPVIERIQAEDNDLKFISPYARIPFVVSTHHASSGRRTIYSSCYAASRRRRRSGWRKNFGNSFTSGIGSA